MLTEKRGTYTRKVQDLPVFGKSTQLHITAYEYHCKNEACEVKSVAEDFSGFLDRYRRMTTRCLDFVILLALETSCEGASRVLGEMGIKISGDTAYLWNDAGKDRMLTCLYLMHAQGYITDAEYEKIENDLQTYTSVYRNGTTYVDEYSSKEAKHSVFESQRRGTLHDLRGMR